MQRYVASLIDQPNIIIRAANDSSVFTINLLHFNKQLNSGEVRNFCKNGICSVYCEREKKCSDLKCKSITKKCYNIRGRSHYYRPGGEKFCRITCNKDDKKDCGGYGRPRCSGHWNPVGDILGGIGNFLGFGKKPSKPKPKPWWLG